MSGQGQVGRFDAKRNELLALIAKGDQGNASNDEFAVLLQCNKRQAQKYLLSLVHEGFLEVQRAKYRHPTLGWCHRRTLRTVDGTDPGQVQQKRTFKTLNYKLTKETAEAIRKEHQSSRNITQTMLSMKYGVSQTAISDVVNFKTWK